MTDQNNIVSVEFNTNKRIDERVEKVLKADSITLPTGNDPLIGEYVRKIEGTYNVARSKEDTDNAIDLLYIAYNTTPQEEGKIRSNIDQLMSRLIAAQQESELKMRGAATAAGAIIKSVSDMFGDWEEARDSENGQDLKSFVGEDLCDLAKEIKEKSERINEDLTKIAATYDGIISDTTETTHTSEQALAARLKDKAEIEAEINKNNADREKLESLVKDLKAEVAKYEKMANEYKNQAETAEDRAFIMSIVQVGAQMVSSAIPAITAGITGAATGGASLVAASAVGTMQQLTNASAATTTDDNTAQVIEAKKDIAEKRSEKAIAESEQADLEKKAKELESEKAKIESNEDIDADTKSAQIAAADKRITDNLTEIEKKKSQAAAATAALDGLNASLKSLDENMGKMAQKQEDAATNLRALQMQMLEKVEAYETEKRNQSAELVKINALLKGQRTEEETIQLAIKSLGLSLKALKRMREIIIEISFFFKSFADFMQQIVDSSGEQSKLIQTAVERNTLTKSFARRIKRNTNNFFVTQVSEWQAVEIVSSKFMGNFKDGWSKLNKLSGNYLTGEDLKSYLDVAAGQIEDIVFKRKEASAAKMADLNRYRERIAAEE